MIGYPIGLLLKRRFFEDERFSILIGAVYGVAMHLLIVYALFRWCDGLGDMPIPVNCTQFLPYIYFSITIGIIGSLSTIYYVTRGKEQVGEIT